MWRISMLEGEFYREIEALQRAVDEAYDAGLIGKNACGSGYDFSLYIHRGSGCLYLRRGNRVDREPRREKGSAKIKAPVPGEFWTLWLPNYCE